MLIQIWPDHERKFTKFIEKYPLPKWVSFLNNCPYLILGNSENLPTNIVRAVSWAHHLVMITSSPYSIAIVDTPTCVYAVAIDVGMLEAHIDAVNIMNRG